MPVNEQLPENLEAEAVIKLPDNITIDDIVPAGTTPSNMRSKVLARVKSLARIHRDNLINYEIFLIILAGGKLPYAREKLHRQKQNI